MHVFKIILAGLCLAGSSLFAAVDNIIPNADFATGLTDWKVSGFVGGKPGTDKDWNNKVVVFQDTDKKSSLRVSCQDSNGMIIDLTTEPGIALDPAWVKAGRMKLSFKATMKGFVQGEETWGRAHVWVTFYNDEEKKVGEYISVISNDIPAWKYMAAPFDIPSDATSLKVQIGFIVATGVMEIRDLSLVPLPAAK